MPRGTAAPTAPGIRILACAEHEARRLVNSSPTTPPARQSGPVTVAVPILLAALSAVAVIRHCPRTDDDDQPRPVGLATAITRSEPIGVPPGFVGQSVGNRCSPALPALPKFAAGVSAARSNLV